MNGFSDGAGDNGEDATKTMEEVDNGNAETEGDEEEDDDPIVHEIPVFVAKGLQDQLHVFQYPVRPAHMSYDASNVVQSRVRPENQQVGDLERINSWTLVWA